MSSNVQLTCDLATPLGRRLMRAWLDVMDANDKVGVEASGASVTEYLRQKMRAEPAPEAGTAPPPETNETDRPEGRPKTPVPVAQAAAKAAPATPADVADPPETTPPKPEQPAAVPARETPPAAVMPAPEPVRDQAFLKRPWTDGDKRLAWVMSTQKNSCPEIAAARQADLAERQLDGFVKKALYS